MVHLEEGRCYDSELYYQDLIPFGDPKNEDQRVNLAKWILAYLFYNYTKSLYPINSSFKEFKDVGGFLRLETMHLREDSKSKGNETPSLNVSLATPLTFIIPESAMPIPPQMTLTASADGSDPGSPISSPKSEDDGSEGTAKTKVKGNFMEKLKTFRLRTPSSRTGEDSPSSDLPKSSVPEKVYHIN